MSEPIKTRGIEGRALSGRVVTGRELGMRAQGGGKPGTVTVASGEALPHFTIIFN